MGHAIFAEVNGVHCRASGVDSGTNNVTCFSFIFKSSMEWRLWFLQKLQQNLQNFDFFSSNLFKKSGIKIFFHIFRDVILFKIWYSLIRYKNFWNMSSCSLVIVHASLKNMVSRKTRLKFLVPKTGGRTWRDKKIHDFHNFSDSGLKFSMRISECICNRIMNKKKYRFFDPFTGEAPLNM